MKTIKYIFYIVILFTIFSFSNAASAQSLNELFNNGNSAFWNGEYKKAVLAYSKLEELGVHSPEVYFNKATAESRLGNMGRAIQYYEKVLKLDPGNNDAIYNLSIIRDFIARRANEQGRDADLAPAVGPWRAVLDRFSPQSAGVSFLAFYVALFVVLLLRKFVLKDIYRLTLGVFAGVFIVLSFVTGAVAFGKWDQEHGVHEATVIFHNVSSVKEGPQSEVNRFDLEEGSRVEILEQHDNWVKIRDDQGRDGWLPIEKIGKF